MNILKKAVIIFMLLMAITVSWLAPMKELTITQVDLGLKRALITFASARALSGLLSVVQTSQVDIQPAGIGVTLSPGQMLAPVNDLVRNFTDLMLLVCVAFGIQKILIGVSDYWVISASMTAVALAWGGCHLFQSNPPRFLSRLLALILMLRFAMPVALLGTDAIFQKFMSADFAVAHKAIESATSQMNKGDALELPPLAGRGWIPKMPDWMPNITDVKAKYAKIKEGVESSTEYIIKLMVIFLLQTILLPIFLIWLFYIFVKSSFQPHLGSDG